ncbi:MAG: hypothetical protein UHD05_03960 [Ruminococcus sp.]|nr:hypothetical protein [Ruminococcus sp.]
MAGRHSAKSSNSLIKIISIIAIIVILVVCTVIVVNIFTNNEQSVSETTASTQQTTTVNEETTAEAELITSEPTTEQGVTADPSTQETQVVVVPTQNGEDVSYFNATFVPYKAIDTVTDTECTLKEVFGSSYAGGVITFNSDGTFSDSLLSSSINKGAYVVEGETISATYENDKNMSISVQSWDGDTPSEFVINYGGYDVYFGL